MSSIRVILSGGLGNQLFQYAAGRTLAERTGAELVLDTITGFKHDKVYNRTYELDVFPGPKACRKADTPSKRAWFWLRLRQRKRIRWVARLLKVLDEVLDGPEWERLKLKSRENLLIGFWQDERYFLPIRDRLCEELAMDVERSRSEQEVALHVRRVQYTRGVGEDYFEQAMRKMRENVPGATFSLFTDDPDWGREFAEERADVACVSQKKDSALDDFRRLRSFQHWIIANSTFSWWAAWLAEREGTEIITPGADAWPNPNTPPGSWTHLKTS